MVERGQSPCLRSLRLHFPHGGQHVPRHLAQRRVEGHEAHAQRHQGQRRRQMHRVISAQAVTLSEAGRVREEGRVYGDVTKGGPVGFKISLGLRVGSCLEL